MTWVTRMTWRKWFRRKRPDIENAREAALEKWAARARLDEQQRRWPEVRRAVDAFTAAEAKALRRQQ